MRIPTSPCGPTPRFCVHTRGRLAIHSRARRGPPCMSSLATTRWAAYSGGRQRRKALSPLCYHTGRGQHVRPALPRHHLGRVARRGHRRGRSTAARRACRCPRRTSSPTSTGARPGRARSSPSARSPTPCASSAASSRGRRSGPRSACSIPNEDMRPGDYREVREKYRPSHADYTYEAKYGIRDWRGGGRTSARETAGRVAAGAIARKLLAPPVRRRDRGLGVQGRRASSCDVRRRDGHARAGRRRRRSAARTSRWPSG